MRTVLWLVVVSVVVAEDPALPGALPPLDDALLQADDLVSAFGHGRVRAVGGDDDAGPAFAGAGLTARVGASGSLGDVRGSVVVGDGAWWVTPTQPSSSATELQPTALTLTTPPLASFVQRLSVEIPLAPLGTPGQLVVGRFPLVIADGRFVGVEGFDARGRSVDGAALDTAIAPVLIKTGVVALDLGAVVDDVDGDGVDDVGPFKALAFVDASLDMPTDDVNFDDVNVDLYLLAHHEAPTLRPTLGARGSVDVWGLRLKGGLDGQLALDETQGLQRSSTGLHGELSARTLLPWRLRAPRPYVEAGVEGTGDVVAPAPTQHGMLGELDLLGFANTWQIVTRAGVTDDDTGFAAAVAWRLVSALDGPLADPRGKKFSIAGRDDEEAGRVFAEVDVDLGLPVADNVDVDVSWAVAVRDGLFAQRVLIGLRFSFGDDDGLLPQF